MIPEMVNITCVQLGTPEEPCEMLLGVLYGMSTYIRTHHGDLAESYYSTLEMLLFGTGKGSGGSPFFWKSAAETIPNSMDRHLKGCQLNCAHNQVERKHVKDIFIAHTSLMTTSDNKKTLAERMEENTQVVVLRCGTFSGS